MYSIEYYNQDFDIKTDLNALSLNSVKDTIKDIDSGNSYYQIFKKNGSKKSLQDLISIADRIKNNFSDLIVIGMGGATLNPQMLVNFLGRSSSSPKIYFLNNTDPYFFTDLLNKIDIKNSAFLAISNSGETLETNALVSCMIAEYKKNNLLDIYNRSFVITSSSNNTLKNVAEDIGATLIYHQQGISGRYSSLSSVSLLVGLISDLNMEDYLDGANEVIDDFYNNLDKSKVALSAKSILSSNKNILVNIGYLQRFFVFLDWYSQIIAESLGKNNKGFTPIKGLGPNDQHTMLQLYLEGAKDKYFSFFYVKDLKSERNINNYYSSNVDKLGYLKNKNLSDLNDVNYKATINALKEKYLPIRVINLQTISEKNFGAIICHLMFETVLIGNLMKINPFDQPGVEFIKAYSKKFLKY